MLRQHDVMSSLRAFGHGVPLQAARQALTLRASPIRRLASTQCLNPLRRELPRPTWRAGLLRTASTAARKARSDYRYPPEINIYRHGVLATSTVGVVRLASLIFAVLGTLLYFPAYAYSYLYPAEKTSPKEQEVKWYIPPLILLSSWAPAIVAFLAFAPWIHQIHVQLPSVARKSREELMRWAGHVPQKTVLSLSVIRFAPWPTARYVTFEDLSRLPFAYTRLTNLEHTPPRSKDFIAESQGSRSARVLEGMARRVFGRYYVSRTQSKDRSAVPGMWDKMWAQIPMEGEMGGRKTVMEQRRAQARPPGPRVLPPKSKP